MSQERIQLLDVFRGIAILSVVLFHYFSRWTIPLHSENFYPYGDLLQSTFLYGSAGVQLFFMISGFVILNSLEKSEAFWSFFKKRMIRLLPSMLICSIIVFYSIKFFDSARSMPIFHSDTYLNFIPSLTFSSTHFWNFVFQRNDIAYVSGSYWSLFPEVVFYIFSGIVFFNSAKGKFLSNWLLVCLVLNGIRIISSPKTAGYFPESVSNVLEGVYSLFFGLTFNHWIIFSIGIIIYWIYCQKSITLRDIASISILIALELYFTENNARRIILIILMGVMSLVLIRKNWHSSLPLGWLKYLGLISYPLYLLHENLGIVLINSISKATGITNPLCGVLVIALMLTASTLVFRYWEQPVTEFLRKKLR